MAFLLVAVGVLVIGLAVLAFRHRRPPASYHSSIEEFERGRRAIAPDDQPPDDQPPDDRPARKA